MENESEVIPNGNGDVIGDETSPQELIRKPSSKKSKTKLLQVNGNDEDFVLIESSKKGPGDAVSNKAAKTKAARFDLEEGRSETVHTVAVARAVVDVVSETRNTTKNDSTKKKSESIPVAIVVGIGNDKEERFNSGTYKSRRFWRYIVGLVVALFVAILIPLIYFALEVKEARINEGQQTTATSTQNGDGNNSINDNHRASSKEFCKDEIVLLDPHNGRQAMELPTPNDVFANDKPVVPCFFNFDALDLKFRRCPPHASDDWIGLFPARANEEARLWTANFGGRFLSETRFGMDFAVTDDSVVRGTTVAPSLTDTPPGAYRFFVVKGDSKYPYEYVSFSQAFVLAPDNNTSGCTTSLESLFETGDTIRGDTSGSNPTNNVFDPNDGGDEVLLVDSTTIAVPSEAPVIAPSSSNVDENNAIELFPEEPEGPVEAPVVDLVDETHNDIVLDLDLEEEEPTDAPVIAPSLVDEPHDNNDNDNDNDDESSTLVDGLVTEPPGLVPGTDEWWHALYPSAAFVDDDLYYLNPPAPVDDDDLYLWYNTEWPETAMPTFFEFENWGWGELLASVKDAAVVLGFDKDSWNKNRDGNPKALSGTALEFKAWEELSEEERTSAELIGFFRGMWNELHSKVTTGTYDRTPYQDDDDNNK